MLLIVVSAALAAPRAGALSGSLQAALEMPEGERAEWAALRPGLADEERVVVVVEGSLSALPPGAQVQAEGGGLVQVAVPWDALAELAEDPGITRVREPWRARPKAIVTEGYGDLFAGEDWQEAGWDGRGQRIAVLDVGFVGAEDLAGGELPEAERLSGGLESSGHGAAVAEIIHDIAPRAELTLVTFQTDVEFLAAIALLEEERFDVVNASIGFDNLWHADGTGPLARAVDAYVADSGATWVGAAGNENERYRVAPLTDADGDGTAELGGAEGVWVHAPLGALDVSFRWSEPMDGAETDLDLAAWESDGSLCAASSEPQAGSEAPFEQLSAQCAGEWLLVAPTIGAGEDVRGLEGFLYAPGGFRDAVWTGSRNLTLPADSRRGIAVGACDLASGEAAGFSSRGPTDDGRLKPDLCAPYTVSTATYGELGFVGTSAASPHVAGLAALVRDGERLDDPDDVARYLAEHALDLGDPGPDTTFGYGAAQLGAPPPCGCGAGGRAGALALLLALPAALGRRRSGRRSSPLSPG